MKFLVLFAAVCIGAAVAEVTQEQQLEHEKELSELCHERGVFANPHDPEHRTFIRCELEPVELQCDEEFIFDAEKLMCVEKPQPPAPVDLNAVAWQEILSCPDVEDKYFRNPYDCSRFYRCYKQGEFSRLDIGTCLPTMIFDDVLETCLPVDTFKSYYGHECANAPLPNLNKEETPVEPEPEKIPEIPEVPEVPEIPEIPDVPELPEETEQHPETPEETEQHPETPEETEQHPETPEETEQHPETPEETEQHPETPEETEQHPETPEETEQHPETPEETEQHPETPEETEQHPEVPEPEHEPEVVEEKKQPSLEDILKQIREAFGKI